MMVLDEVHARGIEIDPSFGNAISQLIMDGIDRPFDPNAIPDVDFYIALCRRAAAMRLPVATRAWHKLLTILAEQQRLDDLESLALDIVRQYSAMDASDWSTMKAHGSDIPEAARQEAPHRHHLLPRDLPWRHPLHPCRWSSTTDTPRRSFVLRSAPCCSIGRPWALQRRRAGSAQQTTSWPVA